MTQPRFELSKWYLDCVSPAGDAVVAYCADLRWRALKIAYASALTIDGAGNRATGLSLRQHAQPTTSSGRVSWCSPALALDGEWRQRINSLTATIFHSDEGIIQWNCVSPSADCRVRVGRREIAGNGYVEHLQMSVPPWALPLQTLRWGRFVTAECCVVWIDWLPSHQPAPTGLATRFPFVAVDGARAECEHLNDDGLRLADGTCLSFVQRRVLRSGRLGTTALARVPRLNAVAATRVLSVRETKWVSRATLRRPGCPAHDGWAIHEVVEWPRR